MNNDIKPGDLVMVVKPAPCCGSPRILGLVFTVTNRSIIDSAKCGVCGHIDLNIHRVMVPLSSGIVCFRSRLKKINPPSIGDSLPTRTTLGVLA